jgi:hypothetical protein
LRTVKPEGTAMPRRTPLQQRARQSAIVSRTILVIFKELRQAYRPHEKNIGRLFQQLLVAMAIRLQDERHRSPTSISALSRIACLPRSNVARAVKALSHAHVIKKQGNGYIGDGSFLLSRLEARYFKRILGAIIGGADELRLVKKNF